jgi:4'-phosphopantetheinyl transferase EntD
MNVAISPVMWPLKNPSYPEGITGSVSHLEFKSTGHKGNKENNFT